MAQDLKLKVRGLHTHGNELSEVPEGALATADNIVIDQDSVAESRRGLDRLSHALSDSAFRANKIFFYQDKQIVHYSTDKLAYYDSGSGWVDYSGSFEHPDSSNAKMRTAEANSNFYFTSSDGVMKLDSYNGSVYSAGMYKGLDCKASLTGTSGFLPDDTQAAYRIVWGYRDANNNLILGAPSQRAAVANSAGGTRDVVLDITIPDGVSTDDLFQVYRSSPSASASDEPNDELYLVYEGNPTSAEITAKTLSITDQTPQGLVGAILYTSDSQGGILQANEPPPFAKDIGVFKNSLFYGNVKSKHRKTFTLLAVGGTSGVGVGDILTIAGTDYTGASAEDAAAGEFEVVTSGTPAQNIADTALSLVRVINKSSSNTSVYAYYLSNADELPGKILIEERGIGGSSFALIASAHGTAYNPQLPTTGTSVSSSNDEFKNAVMFSKSQQPEAVPLLNILYLGSANKEILRVVPLRDSLFILKEDGIFRITGEYGAFRQELFDNTTRLLSPDTAQNVNNAIFALTDQGVVSISETGVQVISRPIEDKIAALYGESLSGLKVHSFAVPYETERKYILFTVSDSADTFPTQAYVYNSFTSAWTRWPLSKTCGAVHPTEDKLYLGDALGNYVNVERKSLTSEDYVDEAATYSITAAEEQIITLTSIAGIEVGDVLYQSDSINSVITSIDVSNSQVTLNNNLSGWTVGSASIFKAIECVVEWLPQTAGNPGVTKQFRECSIIFRTNSFTSARLGFSTDLSGSLEEVTLEGVGTSDTWGRFTWGSVPWGGVRKTKTIRTYVPLEKQRCSLLSVRFTHRSGYGRFAIQGLSLVMNQTSERVSR